MLLQCFHLVMKSIKKITLMVRVLLNSYWYTKQEKIVYLPTIWIFIWFKGYEMSQSRGSKKNSTLPVLSNFLGLFMPIAQQLSSMHEPRLHTWLTVFNLRMTCSQFHHQSSSPVLGRKFALIKPHAGHIFITFFSGRRRRSCAKMLIILLPANNMHVRQLSPIFCSEIQISQVCLYSF